MVNDGASAVIVPRHAHSRPRSRRRPRHQARENLGYGSQCTSNTVRQTESTQAALDLSINSAAGMAASNSIPTANIASVNRQTLQHTRSSGGQSNRGVDRALNIEVVSY